MQEIITHGVTGWIKGKFGYHRVMGEYTPDQYSKYSILASRWRAPFWILTVVFMFGLIVPLYLGLHYINVAIWNEMKGDSICFLDLSGSEMINTAIFDVGFFFPMGSILVLRAFYPFEYKSILEFISVEDKIDNLELGRWMFKWFSIAGCVYFLYGLTSVTLVKKDSVYYKDAASLPQTIIYKNILQIVDYEYFGDNQDPAVATPLHDFWITTKDGEKRIISGGESLRKCLQMISERSGAPFVHLSGVHG